MKICLDKQKEIVKNFGEDILLKLERNLKNINGELKKKLYAFIKIMRG